MTDCEQFHVVKTDPSGNTTILVMDRTDIGARSRIARALMAETNLAAEQVAFLDPEPPRPCDIAIRMMGGEFCGNAVRSAAAWQVFDRMRWQPVPGYGEEEGFDVACSGIGHNVRCVVRRTGRNAFDVTADMPLPRSIGQVEAAGHPLWKAELPGITHFCCLGEKLEPAEKQRVIQAVLTGHDAAGSDAAGVIFWEGDELDPFVYVRETDTLVHESSCGSGTAAVTACLAFQWQQAVHIDARQKGGLIYGNACCRDGRVSFLQIGGPVRITAEGIAYVE